MIELRESMKDEMDGMDETGLDCVLCLDGMGKQQGWVCDVGGREFRAGAPG
jgi:predicted choloylglycine hydrolase